MLPPFSFFKIYHFLILLCNYITLLIIMLSHPPLWIIIYIKKYIDYVYIFSRAGYGNRTRILALGRPHTTTVLIPQQKGAFKPLVELNFIFVLLVDPW